MRIMDDLSGQIATLKSENAKLRAALERAMPWLGKMLADGSHKNCVAPNDLTATFQQAFELLKKQ